MKCEKESEMRVKYREEREKIIKILIAHATITTTIVHLCTSLQSLMWVFFCSKCVKLVFFSISHNFASTNAIAPIWIV